MYSKTLTHHSKKLHDLSLTRWHYAWSWTTAMSDFSGWQQKGKKRIGFWLHPFERFNFSHSSGGKKKKQHLAGHFFFCMKICECSKGKQMKGQTHQTAEGQQQLLTHLEVDTALTWSQTSSVSEGQWILTTNLSQEQAGLMLPGAIGDRNPGRWCWGHRMVPYQRGTTRNREAEAKTTPLCPTNRLAGFSRGGDCLWNTWLSPNY